MVRLYSRLAKVCFIFVLSSDRLPSMADYKWSVPITHASIVIIKRFVGDNRGGRI